MKKIYTFPNGFERQAENMFRRLLQYGFCPVFEFKDHKTIINIPDSEFQQFKSLQKNNPATWGNPQPKEES